MVGAGAMPFGALLRQLREEAGLTQEELAERAGLTAKGIGALERGARQRPYPHTVRALADALGVARETLLAAVPRRPDMPVPPPVAGARFPATGASAAPATPLIGREREVAAIAALLADSAARLVTLTGPGGVGKTRLAVAVTAAVADSFPDGVVSVALAPLTDPALVLATVARALGLHEGGGRALDDLLRAYLAGRRLLLVLDNCEHLLDAAPDLAVLLLGAPGLVLLATSRAPLRVRGECEWPVTPLALPALDRVLTAGEATRSSAVRLFVERAAAVIPGFALTDTTAAAVAAICRRLDGLPLAIELAAVWIRLLPPTALLARLDRALPLLTGGARDLPARQRTLRDTVAWSHDLLNEGERIIFRRLATFVGGCTLAAAEAVVDTTADGHPDAPHTRPAVLDGLAALADASLLTAVPPAADDGPRLVMLATVREYASERLVASGEEEQVRDRHADHYRALAEEAARGLAGPEQTAWLEHLGREHDNLRAALDWTLRRGRAEHAARIGWGLRWYWQIRGFLTEGRRWMGHVLAAGEALSPTARAGALVVIGQLAFAQGDHEVAAAALTAAEQLAREADEGAILAAALLGRGFVGAVRGEHGSAAAWGEESARLHLAGGDAHGASLACLGAAHAALGGGDVDLARRLIDEGEALARTAGAPFALAGVLNVRAMLAQLAGDDTGTVPPLAESLQLSRSLGDIYALGYGLLSLAGALADLGWGEAAARLFGATEALREVFGIPIQYAGSQAVYERQLATLRARLAPSALMAAWEAGRTLDPAAALAEALAAAASAGSGAGDVSS